MTDKRKTIIEAATHLFIKKGYDTTSVQDIVNHSQMSKGSFYNYFQSKEELVVAIIRQSNQERWEKVDQIVPTLEQDPKELFIEQMKVQIDHIISNREILKLSIHSMVKNQEFRYTLERIQAHDLRWISKQIKVVYGSKVHAYVFDCAILLVGLLYSYGMHLCLLEKQDINIDKLMVFVMRRMDAIVESFSSDESPLLQADTWQDFLRIERQEIQYLAEQIHTHIIEMRNQLDKLSLQPKQSAQILACFDTLENQFTSTQSKPEEYLVEGLLLYLKNQKLPGLEKELGKLTTLIHAHFL